MLNDLRDLVRRTRMMITRTILAGVNDATGIQTVQIRLYANEAKDKVPHLQTYGLTSNPHPGAEAVALFVAGDRGNGVVLGIDDRRYRITSLQPGEVCLYTDEDQLEGGHRIIFRRGQEIEILAGQKFTVNVGNGASVLTMTPAGTTLVTPDFSATQGG